MAGLYFVTGALFLAFGRDKVPGWGFLSLGVVYVALGVAVERRYRRSGRLAAR